MNLPKFERAILILMGICALLAWVLGVLLRPAFAPAPQPVPAQVAPEVINAPTVDIKPPKVRVYAPKVTHELVGKGIVPKGTIDPVLASSRIEASERATTVTTVISEATGEARTYTAPAPLPWIATSSRGHVALDAGLKTRGLNIGEPVVRLSVRQEVLQVKALHFGVAASIDTQGDAFVGAGVSYRW
jgi:hypothetical protein